MRMTAADTAAGRAIAMRRLAVDAMTAEVLGAFADAGIPCILLKGLALQERLHGDESLRPYGDADLLVPPGELRQAGAVLAAGEFELRVDPDAHPFRVPNAHAQEWYRGRDAVDLHWRLPGVGAD